MPKPMTWMTIVAAMTLPAAALAQEQQGPAKPAPPPTIYTPKPATDPAPQPQPEPAAATSTSREAPVNGVLFLYGEKEKCPVDANGNEVTVCVRRPAGERFRIPKEIRPESIKPEYQSWANRSDDILETGATGIGSCAPVGISNSGCVVQQFRRARGDNKARKEAEAANSPK